MKSSHKKLLIGFIILLVLGVGIFVGFKFFRTSEPHAEKVATTEPAEPEVILDPEFIDLQPVVDAWLTEYNHGKVAVMVYDLNNDQVAASYNADVQMLPASVYKLFYAYDAYREISAGNDDPNELYLGDKTLGECLDLMMRVSHNPCAEAMLDDPVRSARVAQMITDFGLTNTKSDALMTSAHDVTELLKKYYTHDGWNDESWTKWQDSTLNQPPAEAGDFRQGLPSGFTTAKVYNKVGWSAVGGGWDIYNDAAIVEFPMTTSEDGTKINGRSYVVVVLTRSTSHLANAGLGEMIEAAVTGETLTEEATEEATGKTVNETTNEAQSIETVESN